MGKNCPAATDVAKQPYKRSFVLKLPKNKWPTTSAAMHGLYFAQATRTLLDDRSYESFRVQSLDCLSRLKEINHIASEIDKKSVSFKNLVEPCHEFANTFKSDTSARSIVGNRSEHFLEYFYKVDEGKAKRSYKDVAGTARYLLNNLEPYYKIRLQNDILGNFHKLSKYDLMLYLQRYLSLIINIGYSKSFILEICDNIFFREDIIRFSTKKVRSFFNHFDEEEHNYDIWLPIFGPTIRLMNGIGVKAYKPIKYSELPPSLQYLIRKSGHFSANDSYLHFERKTVDPYSAADAARFVPRLFRSITVLQDSGAHVKHRSYAFIKKSRSDKIKVIHEAPTKIQSVEDHVTRQYTRYIRRYTNAAANSLDRYSFQRIISSSENVSLTRDQTSSSNQLVSIWSAIEMLLGDPPDESSRIDYFKSSIVPCVVINYPLRYANAVFLQVQKSHRLKLQTAMDTAGIEKSLPANKRFFSLFFGDDNIRIRNDFIDSMESNPGAVFLMRRLIDRLGTAENMLKSLRSHQQRVEWQISRIYRSRNQFVHSGVSLTWNSTLARNAFEYYRTSLQNILYEAENCEGLSDIDMLVHTIQNFLFFTLRELESLKVQEARGAKIELLRFFSRR